MAGGRLLQELVEQLALLGVEGAEDVVLRRREGALGRREALRPRGGQVDEVATTVLDRAAPGDEAVGLQLVEQADEVRAVDVELRRERLLRAAVVIAQEGQRDQVARAQPERRERCFRAQAREPREVVQERRGAVGVDGSGRDDPQSSGRIADLLYGVIRLQTTNEFCEAT